MNNDFNDYKKAKSAGMGSALGAALVGAAVGAAAAYLSNSDNRSKLKTKADETKHKAAEMLDTATEKTGDALKEVGDKVKSAKKRNTITDNVEDTYTSLSDTTTF